MYTIIDMDKYTVESGYNDSAYSVSAVIATETRWLVWSPYKVI